MNLEQHLGHASVTREVQGVILCAARSGLEIYQAIKTEPIAYAGSTNTSGETQLSHDLIADRILKKALEDSEVVSCFVSEERETELCFVKHVEEKLLVAFDPIDGSSVAGANFAVGTSLGIYQGVANFLEATGRDQVGAMYLLYGPRLTLVYSVGDGVHVFAWDEERGEFGLEQEYLTILEGQKVCGIGGMQHSCETAGFPDLINFWQQQNFTLRYSGSMAADMNGILKRGGGIFAYPSPKLRLLYECNPFAFLIEQAEGAAVDLCGREILDLPISAVDAASPILIGARGEVLAAQEFLAKSCPVTQTL